MNLPMLVRKLRNRIVMNDTLRARYPDGTKECRVCKRKIPIEGFYAARPAKADGVLYPSAVCKPCSNAKSRQAKAERHSTDWYFKWRFDMPVGKYEDLFASQGGKCAICGTHQDNLNLRLCVDHDHETGKVRGLLCGNCNRGMGFMKHSCERMLSAIEYLKKT